MSYCLAPECPSPKNPDTQEHCQTCGAPLLLRGRYRAISRLGRGGFGVTFLAQDEDLPSRPRCVIKQLRSANRKPRIFAVACRLFEREAAALERLGRKGSPVASQIPQLFAYFVERGEFYLVQEYIEGRTLAQELKKNGRFSEAQVRQLLEEVLPILAYIHSQGVIHRDIKPANLMRRVRGATTAAAGEVETDVLSPDAPEPPPVWPALPSTPPGQEGKLVLIDFGAIKDASSTKLQGGEGDTQNTLINSPGFSPPEQLAGQGVGPTSDLYALAATCVNLLTGCSPNLLYDHNTGIWTWRNRAEISEGLAEVLASMLKPAVTDRYPSAVTALQALAECSGVKLPRASEPAPGPAQLARSGQSRRRTPPPRLSQSRAERKGRRRLRQLLLLGTLTAGPFAGWGLAQARVPLGSEQLNWGTAQQWLSELQNQEWLETSEALVQQSAEDVNRWWQQTGPQLAEHWNKLSSEVSSQFLGGNRAPSPTSEPVVPSGPIPSPEPVLTPMPSPPRAGPIPTADNPVTVAASPQPLAETFRDVRQTWAVGYVEALAQAGIISGFPDGSFRPDAPVTRAEFATILQKAFQPEARRPGIDFRDLPAGHWGANAIHTAYQGGFVTGYPSALFQPNQPVSRVQVLVALTSGLKLAPADPQVLTRFQDAKEIPAYALRSAAAATAGGWVAPDPDLKQLSPNRRATRAEVAAFVYQAMVSTGRAQPLNSAQSEPKQLLSWLGSLGEPKLEK